MSSGEDTHRVVSLSSVGQWLVDSCMTGIFYCAARPDLELLRAVLTTGLPVDRLDVGPSSRHLPIGPGEGRRVRARSISADAAESALGEPPMDFVLADDAHVLRLAYDDHDRLVVGFVESGYAVDRYRLIRDVLWETAYSSVDDLR